MRIIRKIFSSLALVIVCGAVSLGSTLFVLTSEWALDGISGMAKALAGVDTVPAKRKADFDDLKSRSDAQSKKVGKASKGIKSRSAKMVVRNTADVAVSGLPLLGAGTVVLAVWDIADLCETITELNNLEEAFGLSADAEEEAFYIEACQQVSNGMETAEEEGAGMWDNIVIWAGEAYDAVGGTMHELSLQWQRWRAS